MGRNLWFDHQDQLDAIECYSCGVNEGIYLDRTSGEYICADCAKNEEVEE